MIHLVTLTYIISEYIQTTLIYVLYNVTQANYNSLPRFKNSLVQSLVGQIVFTLDKMKIVFYFNNYWIGRATH